MHRSHSSIGRLGAAVLTTSVVACLAIVAPASAATSGVVTVTGGSVSTIELTIPDATAQFGATMSPDGTGAGAEVRWGRRGPDRCPARVPASSGAARSPSGPTSPTA